MELNKPQIFYRWFTEAVEICPHCGAENTYPNYDVVANNYKATCHNCGATIMLCDECLHADGNEGNSSICDWSGTCEDGFCYGRCFRGETINEEMSYTELNMKGEIL